MCVYVYPWVYVSMCVYVPVCVCVDLLKLMSLSWLQVSQQSGCF